MERERDWVVSDGPWLERYMVRPGEDRVYRVLSQPSRSLILERNARLRCEPGAIKNLSWARLALNLPLEDYYILRAKYPDLASRDGEIRTAAWMRFINSAESAPYRIQHVRRTR